MGWRGIQRRILAWKTPCGKDRKNMPIGTELNQKQGVKHYTNELLRP